MNKTTRLKKPQIPELDTLYTFDELGGRPKYGGVEMTSETDIPSFQEIMDETHSAVIAEATARDDADEELQSQINTLDTELAAEVAARKASESDLSDALDQEIADRTAGDDALNSRADTIQGNLTAEGNARNLADIDLQSQIDVIVASSDVKDIVGTKAELDDYDTSTLGDQDIIKVLADETVGGATTYYRWGAASSQFTLIGSEGPYYTKSETDAIAAQKQDVLTAGNGISLQNNNIAVDTSVIATKEDMDTAKDDIDNLQSDVAHLENSKQDNLTAGTDISISNNVVSATNRGLAKVLTADDYNYPANNPTSVALWLLEPGMYQKIDSNVSAYVSQVQSFGNGQLAIVGKNGSFGRAIVVLEASVQASSGATPGYFYFVSNVGAQNNYGVLSRDVMNSLTATQNQNGYVLSAYQGKVLKDMIGDLANLTTEDKTNLVAAINEAVENGGVEYVNLTITGTSGSAFTTIADKSITEVTALANDDKKVIFKLEYTTTGTPINPGTYEFPLALTATGAVVGSAAGFMGDTPAVFRYIQDGVDGYSGTIDILESATESDIPTVVQSTGTSTIDVMSQNATTSMVYADPNIKTKVRIGSGATVNGSTADAIGFNASATGNKAVALGTATVASADGAVALGANSSATQQGEVAIGTSQINMGYNSSNYRLLTGLYDPQSDHDAATKGYVDAVATGTTSSLEINSTDWSDLWQ